jgi:hypothetical protein
MATTMQMGYSDRVVLDPAEYLELRRRNPGVIKQTRLIPPRIGRDKHFGKILVVFAQGRYATAR